MPGILYVIATPIGNLEDITLRALRLLKEVALIAAEDTRVTRKLLSHFDIHTPLTSYHQHTREDKLEALVSRLEAGDDIAMVSDAGTPGISDPGAQLIRAAIEKSISVIPIPGPSAVIAGISVSGLPTGRFSFDGFPPRGRSDRKEFFDLLRQERRTIVLYEAPSRLRSTLQSLLLALGPRDVAVCRELTKKFEEVFRGTLPDAIERFNMHPPRGEFTIVVGPWAYAEQMSHIEDPIDVVAALRSAMDAGMSSRDAVQSVAESTGAPRKAVYRAMIEMGGAKSMRAKI